MDRGWDAIVALRGQRGAAKVGVVGTKALAHHGKEALTNAELALVHEFGVEGRIPERSFIRQSFDTNRIRYIEILKKLARAVLDRKITLRQALEVLGFAAASDTRNLIRTSIPPPNSPFTIEKKGSSTTLVDTGQLINSVTHLVQMGDEGEHASV